MKLDKENKLTNDELEQVAGGNAGECALESEFFHDLGYNIQEMGFLHMEFNIYSAVKSTVFRRYHF